MQSEYGILPLTALCKQITKSWSSELCSAMFLWKTMTRAGWNHAITQDHINNTKEWVRWLPVPLNIFHIHPVWHHLHSTVRMWRYSFFHEHSMRLHFVMFIAEVIVIILNFLLLFPPLPYAVSFLSWNHLKRQTVTWSRRIFHPKSGWALALDHSFN